MITIRFNERQRLPQLSRLDSTCFAICDRPVPLCCWSGTVGVSQDRRLVAHPLKVDSIVNYRIYSKALRTAFTSIRVQASLAIATRVRSSSAHCPVTTSIIHRMESINRIIELTTIQGAIYSGVTCTRVDWEWNYNLVTHMTRSLAAGRSIKSVEAGGSIVVKGSAEVWLLVVELICTMYYDRKSRLYESRSIYSCIEVQNLKQLEDLH